MYTTIDFGKRKARFETREFETGTYIAVYESDQLTPFQSMTNRGERDYHIALRKRL